VIKVCGERPSHECAIGDGMAKALRAAGAVGVVTDGGIRDVSMVERTGIAAFAAGTVASHGDLVFTKPREPVTVAGLRIGDGDLIHGDGDGVIMIPSGFEGDLVEACLLAREFESRVHTFWRRSDKSADEKRKFVGALVRLRRQKWEHYLAQRADWATATVRSAPPDPSSGATAEQGGSRDGE
jgi:regulator of RNase E activity RraA